MSEPRYYGKYKGRVRDVADPRGRGRVQVVVDEVLEHPTWAEPCVPYAAPGQGWLMLPPVGGDVWVEFREGRRQHPVWVGCFWQADGSAPAADATTKVFVLKGMTLTITESERGATVEIRLGDASITATPGAVTITTDAGGKLELDGKRLDVLDGALEVKG